MDELRQNIAKLQSKRKVPDFRRLLEDSELQDFQDGGDRVLDDWDRRPESRRHHGTPTRTSNRDGVTMSQRTSTGNRSGATANQTDREPRHPREDGDLEPSRRDDKTLDRTPYSRTNRAAGEYNEVSQTRHVRAGDYAVRRPTTTGDREATSRMYVVSERSESDGKQPIEPSRELSENKCASTVDRKDQSDKKTPIVKLGSYNGTGILENHLAKFVNIAEYYQWTTRDRLFFLKSSLDGPATQLLLELTAGATEADVIQLLRNRFGCANQQERFRAELRTRRRRPGETVQDLFLDIVRLLSLSYPGQSGELYQSIGRDCFLEALEDPELRIRVLDQQPTTMEQALAIVCRMQAYSNTTSGSASASKTEEADRRRVKTVVAVTSPPQTVATYIDERRIAQLERTIADQQREIRQLKSNEAVASHYNVGMQWTPPTGVQQQQQPIQQSNVGWYPYQASNGPSNWQQQPAMMEMPNQSFQTATEMNGPEKRYWNRKQQNRQPRVDRETCRLCLTKGHWQNSCPLRLRQHTEMSNNTRTDTARTHIDETQQKTVGTIDGDCPSETFMSIIVNGVVMHGLIDTGCDHSVCGSAVLPPDIELKPTDIKLAAANGTNIFVRGITCLNFTVNGTEMYVNVLCHCSA